MVYPVLLLQRLFVLFAWARDRHIVWQRRSDTASWWRKRVDPDLLQMKKKFDYDGWCKVDDDDDDREKILKRNWIYILIEDSQMANTLHMSWER